MESRITNHYIFIATDKNDAKQIEKIVKSCKCARKIISCDGESYSHFLSKGIAFKDASSYFDYKKTNTLFKLANQYAQKWPKLKYFRKLSLKYKYIDLGKVCELSFMYFFAELFYSLEIAKKIIAVEKPKMIIVSKNFNENQWKHGNTSRFTLVNKCLIEIAKNNKIGLLYLSKKDFETSLTRNISGRIAGTIKGLIIRIKKIHLKRVTNKSINNLKHNKICVLAFANLYVLKNMIPLLKKIQSNKNISLVISGKVHASSLKSVTKEQLPFVSFYAYARIEHYIILIREFITLFWKWNSICYNKSINQRFKYKNIKFWSIIKEKYRFHFLSFFPQIIFYTLQLEELVNKNKPRLVVLMEGLTTLSQVLIEVSKSKNIQTLITQHGYLGKLELEYETGDYFAVWGNESKNTLISANIKSNTIYKTGYPLFDQYSKIKTSPVLNLKQPSKKGRQKNIISIFSVDTSGPAKLFGNPTYTIYEKLFNVLGLIKNADIKIRFHPYDDVVTAVKIAEIIGIKIEVINHNIPLKKLINKSDIIIGTTTTTALLDAILLNKPVILLKCFIHSASVSELEKHKAVLPLNKIGELPNLVQMVLNGRFNKRLENGRKRFIAEYLNDNDGKSAKRVADLIYSLSHSRGI